MSSDPEAEIRASVGAHADLGPGYEDAVAEGLVERIGAEIDKRIDARLAQTGAVQASPVQASPVQASPVQASPVQASPVQASPVQASPVQVGTGAPAGAQPGVPAPAGAAGAGAPAAAGGPAGYPAYQGYQGYLGPVLPPGYQLGPPPVRPSQVGARNVATTITALGSMAMGVAATAIVSHTGNVGGQGFIILLIWVAIAIINVAYARRP